MRSTSLLQRDGVRLALIFIVYLALHVPLLSLPYFWDEAGHYIPAARDFMLSGDVIPQTTISNAHPPLPQVYLAAAWSIFGYAPVVTRAAMLLLAALALVQVWRIGERVANPEVALGATICTGLYPVFFAQASLAHADLMATALTLWGLRLYLDGSRWTIAALSLAVMAKETAVVVPVLLLAWELVSKIPSGAKARKLFVESGTAEAVPFRKLVLHLVPIAVLVCWFAYHYSRTGYVFGNPEFFRYNVATTLEPLRILLAALRRVWQVTGYMNLWVLTAAMAAAMLLPPLANKDGALRKRIAIPTQLLFLTLILAHVVGHALIGGAVLARYMMPVIPLVILIAVSTLWRRVPRWRLLAGFVAVTFVAGWFVPPLTSFAPEDNLNYASYVRLHQRAAGYLSERYSRSTVLTAWPASDEIAHPYLGYVPAPLKVVRVEHFSFDQVMLARQNADYDVAFVFSTRTPRSRLRWDWWNRTNKRFFDLHEDVNPTLAAELLGGRIVMQASENDQWVAVVEINRARNAD